METSNTSRRWPIIALGVIVLMLGAVGYIFRTPSAVGEPAAASAGVSNVQPPHTASAQAGVLAMVAASTPSRPASTGRASQDLLDRYNAGDNIRVVIAHALEHPEKGGAFYASRLLTQCRGLSSGTEILEHAQLPHEVGQADYALRVGAVNRLKRRCADLLPDELGIGRDREILADGAARGDPLVKAATEYSRASQGFKDDAIASDARRSALNQVLATQDPLLLEDLGTRMAMYVDAQTGRRYHWFAGKAYFLESDVDVGGAFYLLPCGLGMTCDSTEFTTAMRCASGEGCDASRFDYLRRIYESRPGAYEKVTALYSAMLEAVRAGNASAFIR